MKILVTGGAGFIGSNFIHYILKKEKDIKIVNLDVLSYAGNLENLIEIENNPNYEFVKGDITDSKLVMQVAEGVDAIINFAAETHVDRSITGPDQFVKTNVMGTLMLLEAAKTHKINRYIQVSTDEVYGSLGKEGLFSEDNNLLPNSPYSASKAGADLLVRSYFETYGLPTLITRCSNNYGPRQYPEKLMPLLITNIIEGKKIPIYGDGLNIRDWLYVDDHCSAILAVLKNGKAGNVYNVGGDTEKTNLEIAHLLLEQLGADESSIEYVADRLGHDRRYAIDANKLKTELNWKPEFSFETGIQNTIEWYKTNTSWWQKLKGNK